VYRTALPHPITLIELLERYDGRTSERGEEGEIIQEKLREREGEGGRLRESRWEKVKRGLNRGPPRGVGSIGAAVNPPTNLKSITSRNQTTSPAGPDRGHMKTDSLNDGQSERWTV